LAIERLKSHKSPGIDQIPAELIKVGGRKICGKIEKNEMGRACGAYGGGERCAKERDHWGDPDIDGRLILRWIFRKWEGVVGTGWSWFRIGTGGGHL
jgi:hypothetical protein